VWWALAGLGVLAAVLVIVLVARARRRKRWDAELATAQGEVAWLADELSTQFHEGRSAEEISGGWQVASGRVTLIEDRLVALEAKAPDEARSTRARELKDVVRATRRDMVSVLVAQDPTARARDLASIVSRLRAALAPSGQTP
jgi:hypothetical protein